MRVFPFIEINKKYVRLSSLTLAAVYVCGISVCIALLQIAGVILTSSLFSKLHRIDKYSGPDSISGQISSWDSD